MLFSQLLRLFGRERLEIGVKSRNLIIGCP